MKTKNGFKSACLLFAILFCSSCVDSTNECCDQNDPLYQEYKETIDGYKAYDRYKYNSIRMNMTQAKSDGTIQENMYHNLAMSLHSLHAGYLTDSIKVFCKSTQVFRIDQVGKLQEEVEEFAKLVPDNTEKAQQLLDQYVDISQTLGDAYSFTHYSAYDDANYNRYTNKLNDFMTLEPFSFNDHLQEEFILKRLTHLSNHKTTHDAYETLDEYAFESIDCFSNGNCYFQENYYYRSRCIMAKMDVELSDYRNSELRFTKGDTTGLKDKVILLENEVTQKSLVSQRDVLLIELNTALDSLSIK